MDVRALELGGHPGAGVALGLYRRGRVRDLGGRPTRRRIWPSGCWPTTEVLPIGLGARDSLRLEAGLCLYGHDIDADHDAGRGGAGMGDPAGAAARAARGRAAFPARRRSSARSPPGAARRRVGLLPEGRAPMREGVELFAEEAGAPVGRDHLGRLRSQPERAGRHGLCRHGIRGARNPTACPVAREDAACNSGETAAYQDPATNGRDARDTERPDAEIHRGA